MSGELLAATTPPSAAANVAKDNTVKNPWIFPFIGIVVWIMLPVSMFVMAKFDVPPGIASKVLTTLLIAMILILGIIWHNMGEASDVIFQLQAQVNQMVDREKVILDILRIQKTGPGSNVAREVLEWTATQRDLVNEAIRRTPPPDGSIQTLSIWTVLIQLAIRADRVYAPAALASLPPTPHTEQLVNMRDVRHLLLGEDAPEWGVPIYNTLAPPTKDPGKTARG